MSTSSNPRSPGEFYRDRQRGFLQRATERGRRSSLLSRVRLGAFFAAVAPLLLIETSPAGWGLPLATLGGGLFVVFAVLVAAHRRVRRSERRLLRLADFAAMGLARLRRDWSGLPASGPGPPPGRHSYAADLDVFGEASLLHLLGTPGTPSGRRTLSAWLLDPAPPDTVRARQEAVQELTGEVDFRDELRLRAEPARNASPEAVKRFVTWAGDEPWLLRRPALVWASRLVPVATLGLLTGHLGGWIDHPLWVVPVALALLLLGRTGDRLRSGIEPATEHEGPVRAYGRVLELISETPLASEPLRRIGGVVAPTDRTPAHQEIGRLRKRLDLADLRSSAMVHFPLQVLLLWDFHVLLSLERWRARAGASVGEWVDAVGEVEALATLATLSHDHPDWAFPDVDPDGPREVEGAEVGHPLLPPDRCVRNDVRVGPPGTLLLVTGSNMSGKSTLLRAVGLNTILAQAGAPVCASRFRLPPLRVWTSMRIQDSLAEGVSFFMAELHRLRAVVEAARGTPSGDFAVLYLLDEILQGTNTAERQIAARRILRYLLATDAVGAVTTHDLTLADAPDLRERSRRVHFRETVRKERDPETGRSRTEITFDYRLREGIATSRNALQLMEAVGLGEEDAGAGEDAGEGEGQGRGEGEVADGAPEEAGRTASNEEG